MKLSTRSRYGVRLMLDLALHSSGGPVHLGAVARRQGVGIKYLEQIAMPLKRANYLKGIRGPKGGLLLARAPEDITIAGVVELLEGELKLTRCIDDAGLCDRSEHCVTRMVWAEVTEAVRAKLESISLRDLMNRVPSVSGPEQCPDEVEKP